MNRNLIYGVVVIVAAVSLLSYALAAHTPVSNTTTFNSSSLSTQTVQYLSMKKNTSQPVALSINGGSSGLSITNLTFSVDSEFDIMFPPAVVNNASNIKICYVKSGLPTCSFTQYKSNAIPNYSADANTMVNYSFIYTSPIGYFEKIPSGQTYSVTIVLDAQSVGNFAMQLWADSRLESTAYIAVS